MMKHLKYLIILSAIVFFMSCAKNEKTGYILIQKVFLEFEYKKELEAKFQHLKEQRIQILDSMEIELKYLANQIKLAPNDNSKIAAFQVKKETYIRKRNEFDNNNLEVSKQFDEQIFKQINQYVKEYGEKNDYKIIYGSDGSGNIMYADSTMDISGDIIAFINNQYNGKSK